jgi:hypothetical protein
LEIFLVVAEIERHAGTDVERQLRDEVLASSCSTSVEVDQFVIGLGRIEFGLIEMYHLHYEDLVKYDAQTAVAVPTCSDADSTVNMVPVREDLFAAL